MNTSIDRILPLPGQTSLSRRVVLGTAFKLGVAALAATSVGQVGVSAQGATQYKTTAALNLRSGPGTSYPVITVMPAGTIVAHTGASKNGFFEVGYNGTYGWAYRDYLAPVGGGANPPIVSSAVTTTALNLRSGPSTGHRVLQVVQAGVTVGTSNSVQNGYRYVAPPSGPAGWVVDGGLRHTGQPTGETFTTTAALNLRAEPSTSAKVLLVMPSGAKVRATNQGSGSFRQVVYNGVTGWAHTAYLN